jgi:hypothetical protein
MRAAAAWAANPGLKNALYLLLLFVLILVPVVISELLYSTFD